jgi:hypothetical protein
MKANYLFPHKFKKISGLLFLIFLAAYITLFVFDAPTKYDFNIKVFAVIGDVGFFEEIIYMGLIDNYILDEVFMLVIIPAGIIYSFSREHREDEMVASIRLHSLAWATIANYLIILFCYMFIFGLPFLNILMAAMFSQLLIFIVLFRYRMFRFNKSVQDEE